MKKIKGFTLVELIIVMAIFAILMAAIMQMFKPIRDTYVDSTLYETQRTAQNGVIQYITESVRFATDMGIYNSGVSTADDAVKKFTEAYLEAYKVTDPAKITDVTNILKGQAEIIVIDNTNTTYGQSSTLYGRLVRRKLVKKASGGYEDTITDDYKNKPDYARLALGDAYYGDNVYSIGLDVTDKANGVLKVTVASTTNYGGRSLDKSQLNADGSINLSSNKLISTQGEVLCRNLAPETVGGVQTPGMYHADTVTTDGTPVLYTGSSTVKGAKTYIVFINSDVKRELNAKIS